MVLYKNKCMAYMYCQFFIDKMLSQTKIEENSQLNLLVNSPFYKKVFCQDHNRLYQYLCMHPSCNGFTCGKIECIDNHFHQNQLKIQKFNVSDLIHKIRRVEQLSKLPEIITPGLNQLKNSIDILKERCANLFKDYKNYKNIADFLKQNVDDPMNQDYQDAMETFQEIRYKIKKEIQSLSESINWKNAWITLQDELQIAQKLKISFVQFKNMYFELFYPTYEFFETNDKGNFFIDKECEGIVLLYFTHELYLIGEFIPSNNVDTCKVFLHNFLFVANNEGQIDQYSTSKQVISFHRTEQKEGLNEFIRIIDKEICEKEGLQQLAIKKMVCFLVYSENQ